MDQLFAHLQLVDTHQDIFRNIVSIHDSQDLFDDLSNKPEEWRLAQQVEDAVKPQPYQSNQPIIYRPFEDAQWFNAIGWPFKHRQSSRFSDGSFGVWYGSESIETTAHETAYHWFNGLLRDAGFESSHHATQGVDIIAERKIYNVRCDAALIDLRLDAMQSLSLIHPSNYSATQAIGARLKKEGHPGLIAPSVRRPQGDNYVILNPAVLIVSAQLPFNLQVKRRNHHCRETGGDNLAGNQCRLVGLIDCLATTRSHA
jgi:RES domain